MRSVTDRFLRGCGASSVALVIALTGFSASAQAPAASRPAASSPAPKAAPKAPARPAARRTPARKPVAAARPRTSPTIRTVASANTAARDVPTPGAYVNATLFYDYEPGRLYTVHTSPRFLDRKSVV